MSTIYLTLYLLYGLNTAVLLAGFNLAFRRERVYSVLYAALAAFEVLGALSGAGLNDFSISTLEFAQSLMLVANLLLFVTYEVLDRVCLRGPAGSRYSRTFIKGPRRYYVCVTLLFVVMFALALRTGWGALQTNWSEMRASAGALDFAANLIGFGTFPAIWISLRKKHYAWWIFFATLAILFFEMSGSRALLATVAMTAFLDLLFSKAPYKRKIVLLMALFVLGFGAHLTGRLTRGFGLAPLLNEITSGHLIADLKDSQDVFAYGGGEENILKYYYFVIDRDSKEYPYNSGLTMIRLALIFVPRQLVQQKPRDLTYEIWMDALATGFLNDNGYLSTLISKRNNDEPGSLHATLWGDSWCNFRWAGILSYPVVVGLLTVAIEKWFRRLSWFGLLTIAPTFSVAYLWVARGNVVVGVGYIAYLIPLLVLFFTVVGLPLLDVPRHPRRQSTLILIL